MKTKMSLRQQKKQQTRLDIAQAAIRLFKLRGFDQVTIIDIADAARVSKMTVFNYFSSKEDMFFFFADRIFPEFAEIARQAGLPLIALGQFVATEFAARAEWTGLHANQAEFAHLIEQSPTLAQALQRRAAAHFQQVTNDLIEVLSVRHAKDITSEQSLALRIIATQTMATIQALIDYNHLNSGMNAPSQDFLDRIFHALQQQYADVMHHFE